jgi:hypothetical protein
MYFFDPRLGESRRTQIVDQAEGMMHEATRSLDVACRDMSDRVTGLIGEVRDELTQQNGGDRGPGRHRSGGDQDERAFLTGSPIVRAAACSIGSLFMLNCAIRRRPKSILFGTIGFLMVMQSLGGASTIRRIGEDLEQEEEEHDKHRERDESNEGDGRHPGDGSEKLQAQQGGQSQERSQSQQESSNR